MRTFVFDVVVATMLLVQQCFFLILEAVYVPHLLEKCICGSSSKDALVKKKKSQIFSAKVYVSTDFLFRASGVRHLIPVVIQFQTILRDGRACPHKAGFIRDNLQNLWWRGWKGLLAVVTSAPLNTRGISLMLCSFQRDQHNHTG